jgi:uncharacterized damage-inducible protein DinB
MTAFDTSRDALAATLEQPLPLLADLADADFVASAPESGVASIGAHLRHVGDAVECLLRGIGGGRIDYDKRARETRFELDRDLTCGRLRDLAARVRRLDSGLVPEAVFVSHDAPKNVPVPVAASTPERELVFLASHCVHHFALVAIMLRRAGIVPPPEFGVAVSTLRHREDDEVCAHSVG